MTTALEALKGHQQQLDADGCMVGVSRQALDETLALVDSLLATSREILEMFEARRDMLALVGPKEGLVLARIATAISKTKP